MRKIKRVRSQVDSLKFSLYDLLDLYYQGLLDPERVDPDQSRKDADAFVSNLYDYLGEYEDTINGVFDEYDEQIGDSVRRVKDSESEIKAVIDEVLSDYFPDLTVEDYHIYGEREDGLLAEPEISGCDMYVFKTESDAKAYILDGYGVECVDGAMRDDEWVDYLINGGVEPETAEDLIERQDWQGVVEVLLDTAGAEWFLASYSGDVFYNGGYAIYF